MKALCCSYYGQILVNKTITGVRKLYWSLVLGTTYCPD